MTLSHPHGQIYAYPFVAAPGGEGPRLGAPATGRPPAATCSPRSSPAERSRPPGGRGQRALDRVRAGRRPLALRGAALPDTAGCPTCRRSTDAERDAFVEVYLDVLGRFAHRFDTPMPYIASWNQAPVRDRPRATGGCTCSCSRCRRAPGKLKYLAGSESGMGAFITDTNPEDVAEQLRAVVVT